MNDDDDFDGSALLTKLLAINLATKTDEFDPIIAALRQSAGGSALLAEDAEHLREIEARIDRLLESENKGTIQ